MIHNVVVDTSALIAFLDGRDQHHEWARSHFAKVMPPLLSCEAVLAEACYLAPRASVTMNQVLELVERGVVRLSFNLADNLVAVSSLVQGYANIPMSLADACLVRMSELVSQAVVFTLDSDFRLYRRHRRQKIPLLMPGDQ